MARSPWSDTPSAAPSRRPPPAGQQMDRWLLAEESRSEAGSGGWLALWWQVLISGVFCYLALGFLVVLALVLLGPAQRGLAALQMPGFYLLWLFWPVTLYFWLSAMLPGWL